MPTLYDVKPYFQALLRPLTGYLAARGVNPNQVTVSALALSVGTGMLVALSSGGRPTLLLVPLVLLIRMALNAIDGMLAREHAMQTPLGAILNELGDGIADAALYLPFALIPGMGAGLVVAFVALALIGEMAGMAAVQVGASRRYDGPMGKSDRALLFGLIGLLLGMGVEAHLFVNFSLAGALVLLLLTIKNRVQKALQGLS